LPLEEQSLASLSKDTWKLIILHTNDSHGHIVPFPVAVSDICSQLKLCDFTNNIRYLGGFPQVSNLVKDIRSNNSNVLLFDTGDMFCGSMMANLTKGRAQLKIMNTLQYDAMCPGNHDVDYGIAELKSIAAESSFPLLAANLLDKTTKEPYLGKPYVIKDINDLKLGIYGLTYHLTPETTSKINVEEVEYGLDYDAIQRDIDFLYKSGVNYVIVLSHLGIEVDKKLALKIKGINAILGGLSHDPVALERINNVIISQTTPHLSGIGYLELEFKKNKCMGSKGKIIPVISENIIPDAPVQNLIHELENTYKSSLHSIVGYTSSPIIRDYKKESPSETLFGNILRLATGSEISILPGSEYGVTIPQGPLTTNALVNLFPHNSPIYYAYLSGSNILKALEQSVYNQINPDASERVGGLIQVTGLQFTYTYEASFGNHVKSAFVNGLPLQKDKYYRVVMNQLMMEGGHKYKSLTNGVNIKKCIFNDIEFITNWLSLYSPVHSFSHGWSVPLSDDDIEKGQKQSFTI
jgi:5'-nucleotidase / UDP-sugar diphosphatase